jgi:hypothetical protein
MIPAKLTVTGHDNSARALRRAHPRQGRFLRFGNDFVVRPKRRIEVDMATLIRHKDAVVEKIRSGSIVLSHATDAFVSVEEFLAFCGAAPVPQEAPVAAVEPQTVPETAPEPETAATGNVEPALEDEPAAEQAESAVELEPAPEAAPEAAPAPASYDNNRGKKGRR